MPLARALWLFEKRDVLRQGRPWMGVSINAFIGKLDAYVRWYNEKRIKLSLGGMSPLEYRRCLGLIA